MKTFKAFTWICPILILKKFSDTQDLSLKIFSDIKRNYLSTYLKKTHTPCRSVHLNSLYKEIFKCIVIYISFYKVLNISHGMLE